MKVLESTLGDQIDQKKNDQKRHKIVSSFYRLLQRRKDLVEEVSCRRRQAHSDFSQVVE